MYRYIAVVSFPSEGVKPGEDVTDHIKKWGWDTKTVDAAVRLGQIRRERITKKDSEDK